MNDPVLKLKVEEWASDAIADEDSYVRDVLVDYVKGLGASDATDEEKALKDKIITSVVDYVKAEDTSDDDMDAIITSITDKLNSDSELKDSVVQKTIEILSAKDEETVKIKNTVIESVVEEISNDKEIKDRLINELVGKITGEEADIILKSKVIDAAIHTVVHYEAANEKAIELVNDFIEEDEAFKSNIISHIIDYILEDPNARAEAMDKVVTKIESSDEERNKAIEFAFDVLAKDKDKRDEIVAGFLDELLADGDKKADLAEDVIEMMFGNSELRNEILEIGFEQMFSSPETIEEVVKIALDELIGDAEVRREMILAVISTPDGRKSVLDILFKELERDSTFIDKMIDIAMKGKYGDMVDKFVYDLINSGTVEINPDNRQIAEEIVLPMLDSITFDTVLAKLPEIITDVLPQDTIEQIFNKFKSKAKEALVEGIEEAKQGNSKVITVMIDNDIDVVNSILIPAYNKVFPKVVDKAEDFYYYNENVYIKAIVDMIDPEVILDHTQPASSFGTGYRLRDAEFYYELLNNVLILADDAGDWYLNNISDEQIDKAIAKFESALNKVVAKLDSVLGGRIPEGKIDTVISYIKKALDKREAIYDSTTNGAFERFDDFYEKLISFVKEKVGTDLSTDTTIEVTFDGSNLIVNGDGKVNIDNYEINVSVKGYTFKLNSHSITVGGKTVDISGYVQKIADIFGTRNVTVKFTEERPYEYSVHIGNNYVRVSAIYE